VGRAGDIVDVAALVRVQGRRSVVILAHSSQREAVQPWLDQFGDDRVHVLAPTEVPEWHLDARPADYVKATTPTQVSIALKRLGPIDLIVSLLPAELLPGEAPDQYDLFQRVFRHLNRGGAYILDRTTAPVPSSTLGVERWTNLLAAAEDPELAGALRRRDVELAASVGTIIVSRDLIVATKRLGHLLKLREEDVTPVLAAREPKLTWTQIDRRRGLEFRGRARVTSHGDLVSTATLPESFRVPAMHLRHYHGRIGSAGGSLLFTGRTVLPDSFRWHMSANPTNIRLTSVSPDFARIESRFVPKRWLHGDYYFLDSSNSGHFGHVTTEVISRLWGWDRAKQQFPELKALFHLKPHSQRHPELELMLFEAFGIAPEDIMWVNEPVWLESVVSATPMWHNEVPHYVHPEIESVWARLTDGLLPQAVDVPTYDRIFVSRRIPQHRWCRNRSAVEELFTTRGFRVVFPEEFTLPEQVALFANARVVAGFAGSAMFNLMHARKMQTTIVLSHDAYTARNEHLFTAVLGGEAHYLWSPSDVPQPEEGWSKKAFFSEWEFDFVANGAKLTRVLDEA
jgi:capsular polysaccharide biosynthesis protein